MVAFDGGIFTFGDVPFHGSLGANPPAAGVYGRHRHAVTWEAVQRARARSASAPPVTGGPGAEPSGHRQDAHPPAQPA